MTTYPLSPPHLCPLSDYPSRLFSRQTRPDYPVRSNPAQAAPHPIRLPHPAHLDFPAQRFPRQLSTDTPCHVSPTHAVTSHPDSPCLPAPAPPQPSPELIRPPKEHTQ